jgi:hypothetical protein
LPNQFDRDSLPPIIWEGIVSRDLFWLADEQWAKIAPLLPTDVRGKARVDDRRVISGIQGNRLN